MSARRLARLVAVVVAVPLAGCMYSFRAGSFPPEHIRTIAIEPFDNETNRFELSAELYERLLNDLPGALGIRTAGADVADAVVRGSIRRFDVVTPNYTSGGAGQAARVTQRQVSISISVEIIDLVENVILWESTNLTTQGEFVEGAPETEGRSLALDLLVQRIVDGAQSNW
jgi:hypothetical protein